MTVRLHSGADDRKHVRVRPGQVPHRDGGDRGGTRFGDVASVGHAEQRAGCRVEEHDRRLMRRQALRGVAWEHRHQLRAHQRRFGIERRHHAKKVSFADLKNGADRLHHTARGEGNQRRLHGLDQFAHGQGGAHVRLGKPKRH